MKSVHKHICLRNKRIRLWRISVSLGFIWSIPPIGVLVHHVHVQITILVKVII